MIDSDSLRNSPITSLIRSISNAVLLINLILDSIRDFFSSSNSWNLSSRASFLSWISFSFSSSSNTCVLYSSKSASKSLLLARLSFFENIFPVFEEGPNPPPSSSYSSSSCSSSSAPNKSATPPKLGSLFLVYYPPLLVVSVVPQFRHCYCAGLRNFQTHFLARLALRRYLDPQTDLRHH
eukprot:UN05014